MGASMNRARTTAVLSAAAAAALLAGCVSAAPTDEPATGASEFESMDSLYEAVNESAGCDPDAPAAPDMLVPPGDVIGESKMCTSTVMVTWFGDEKTAETALRMFSPESHGGIQLDVAAGSNWTVADLTDVAVGASPSAIQVNLEKVADDLGGYMVDHN